MSANLGHRGSMTKAARAFGSHAVPLLAAKQGEGDDCEEHRLPSLGYRKAEVLGDLCEVFCEEY
jgi:hypothetical protein